ncbi:MULTISPECIES: hypothetical protein [Salipiger]|uniref:Uncharacterized protein n=1 Tax=Salipiger bermudensis (strain DSM 26914 / JCM 13377 / KCTC 12554 / HTCC2601) TaxID=314265 RepID=Q0FP75_SALBH|nr:hypothetical protein [Salipiger bermudensis]EAU45984.1 hypothetical protein R2601_26961 [Salipiger bermudensis HTCC2601]MBN9677617.1 hypothetical protein [Salipiger bermudensis]MCA1286908.1 hypothetical protein [Salipiger bermudensis]
MDYSKSGGARPGSNAPRYDRHKDAPKGKVATAGKAGKAELLARMKAAQSQGKDAPET